MNTAAVKQRNHARRVEKLTIQERIYITMNDGDHPLMGTKFLRMTHQLGLGYKDNPATHTYYVDFSNIASVEHNLFLGRSQPKQENPYLFIL